MRRCGRRSRYAPLPMSRTPSSAIGAFESVLVEGRVCTPARARLAWTCGCGCAAACWLFIGGVITPPTTGCAAPFWFCPPALLPALFGTFVFGVFWPPLLLLPGAPGCVFAAHSTQKTFCFSPPAVVGEVCLANSL